MIVSKKFMSHIAVATVLLLEPLAAARTNASVVQVRNEFAIQYDASDYPRLSSIQERRVVKRLRPRAEADRVHCLVNMNCTCSNMDCYYIFGMWTCQCRSGWECKDLGSESQGNYCTYFYDLSGGPMKCDTVGEDQCRDRR